MRTLIKIVVGIAVVLVVGVAIAFLLNLRREGDLLERFPPPGKMVDIGGRRLHLQCRGADTKPVVVFENGAFATTVWYRAALDEVAKIARVCMYDRAGLGWSDPVPAPRSLGARVDDLHALLEKAHESPPYILVGHSMGGLLARIYTKKFPNDVAGLVLIESSEEQMNGSQRSERESAENAKQIGIGAMVLSLGIQIPQVRFPNGPADQEIIQRASVFRAGQDDLLAMSRLTEELQSIGSLEALDDLPLVVVQQGRPDPNRAMERAKEWREAQARLARLSTRSEELVAERSWHSVMNDEPEMYRIAVAKVLDMIRTDTE